MDIKRTMLCVASILFLALLIVCETKVEGEINQVDIEVTRTVKECNRTTKRGDTIIYHYTATFWSDGRQASSSRTEDTAFTPHSLTLGTGTVMPGLDEALMGMCQGEERVVTIPARLAYGKMGYGDVIPVSCQDTHSDTKQCVRWARAGECEANPDWMIENCQRACAGCEDGVDPLIFDVELVKIDIHDKLKIETTKKIENCDKKTQNGDTIKYHYKGTFVSGEEFDSGPYVFTVGAGQVIKGVEYGMLEMCEGEARNIIIPSRLAYGDRGYGNLIPGGATLVFDVELQEIKRPAPLKVTVTHAVDGCIVRTRRGDSIAYHYVGTLENGVEFDSSHSRNEPYRFTLGGGRVIQGMERGMLDMCEGERRRITIPSHLGYGDQGSGGKIPGGATLIFDVELLTINRKMEL